MSSTPDSSTGLVLAELEKTQQQIVAGLLQQQPTIVQTTAVSGTTATDGVDYASLLQTLQALSGSNIASLKAFSSFLERPQRPEQQQQQQPHQMLLIKDEEPRSSASSSPSSTGTGQSSSTQPHEPEYKPRNVREKVYADGYIMSFDKKSCCGNKYFWRCERKNDCNARMHSDIHSREIVRKLHPHNHERPSAEELAFYEQDFSVLDPNYCHPVKSINRSYMQRKLSRASHFTPPQSSAQPVLPEPTEAEANGNMMLQAVINAAAAASASTPPQGLKRSSPSSPGPVKLKSPRLTKDDEALMTQEDFKVTYELTKKIMELMKPKTEIGVRWQGNEESLLLFLSHDNGAEENVFFPVVVMSRDEAALIAALEGFTGKRCEGKIAMSYSQKVNVLVHEALISNWTHGKLFLVNSDAPALWRLTPVDAYGETLNSV